MRASRLRFCPTDFAGFVETIRLPIDDFSVPVPFQAPRFWKDAERVAAKVTAGVGVPAKRRF
jgi:hypothetical protein